MRTRRSPLAALAILGLLASGCGLSPFGSDEKTVTAAFDDVVDLVPDGSVRLNDVQVGRIAAIELTEDHRAEVTMSLAPDAPIPSDVTAVLAKTSVLGERYIDLVPGDGSSACCIEDGTVIDDTTVRTDLEDLVASGSDLLVSVSADAVRTTIELGAEAFGGRERLIGGFIDDVNAVVGTFNDNSDDLLELIDALDRVTAAYAPNAADNAAVLEDLRVAAAALEDQDERLLDTLDDVTTLSDEATVFLSEHQDEIQDFVRRARKVVQEVEQANGSIETLLDIGPLYTTQLTRGALNGEAQVWLDVIVCGVDDEQGDPSRDCTPPNPGQRTDPPPYHPVPEECWRDPDPCRGSEG